MDSGGDISRQAQTLTYTEGDAHLVIEIGEEGEARLLHVAATPLRPETLPEGQEERGRFRLVEVQATGEDHDDHHDMKHTGGLPGKRLRYVRHSNEPNAAGRLVSVEQRDPVTGLVASSFFQLFTGLPVVRAWTTLRNDGPAPLPLEYVSSFALTGLTKEADTPWEQVARLHVAHNTWCGECQWRSYSLPELGLAQVTRPALAWISSMKRLSYAGLGTWSTAQYLPMGAVENTATDQIIVWQIECNGSWHWEVSDLGDQLYLRLSGPTDQESQWRKLLAPGETFTSVPVALAVTRRTAATQPAAFDAAIGALTQYRRRIRRPNADDERLPVIFNDYMNALNADPTSEKELPLIEAAAQAGCEVFCIDAGWYAEQGHVWWDTVGVWQASPDRFVASGGLVGLLETIRARGMTPGLWLELEVVGVNSPFAREAPDAWFFTRDGRRVADHGRYQLDFRSPEVRAYADTVIARLVEEYGAGYIKMDYNINAGVGTDAGADSLGDGLLEHTRAYLAWLDGVFARYPELVIENCSSGGMRMDYALLARHSIQSTSDQMDYQRTSLIAAAAPTAVTPEQGAVWAYPLRQATREAVVTNMVNALLGRIHLSGQLAEQTEEGTALIAEAIALYKTTLRRDIPHSLPIWPLGLPTVASRWLCLGLVRPQSETQPETVYLSVWRTTREATETQDAGPETHELPLPQYSGVALEAECLYPHDARCAWRWDTERGMLSVTLPGPTSARLFRLTRR